MSTPVSEAFSSFAFLVAPADPAEPAVVVPADLDWSFEQPAGDGAPSIVWGRGPLPGGQSLGAAVRHALTRDRALGTLRRSPPPPYRGVRVHPLPPPMLGPPGPRNRLRSMLFGGAVAVLTRDNAARSVAQEVADAAGVSIAGAIRPRSGGGALVRVHLPDGSGGVLRIARAGEPADPGPAVAGLRHLMSAGIAAAPRAVTAGESAGASWSLETAMPGKRPRHVGERLTRQIVDFLTSLPRTESPPRAIAEDLAVFVATSPQRAAALATMRTRLSEALTALPGVTRHGDFWAGNLLVTRGRLSGVVDWDSWHDSGVPGTDLLHLLTTEERRRSGRALAEIWGERPWRSDAFAAQSRELFGSLGVRPDPGLLDAIGSAWWLAAVAGTLGRLPHRATDASWLAKNVDPVLAALSR